MIITTDLVDASDGLLEIVHERRAAVGMQSQQSEFKPLHPSPSDGAVVRERIHMAILWRSGS
jgi:hypothetical protein